MTIYDHLNKIANTLNRFCLIEISVIIFFSWMCFDLLQWYQSMMTIESFNAIAFWGAITGLITTIFTSIRYINQTLKDRSNASDT